MIVYYWKEKNPLPRSRIYPAINRLLVSAKVSRRCLDIRRRCLAGMGVIDFDNSHLPIAKSASFAALRRLNALRLAMGSNERLQIVQFYKKIRFKYGFKRVLLVPFINKF